MKMFLIVALILVCSAAHTLSWWGGAVDTMDIRDSTGQLCEQFQQFTYDGNDRTYKYGFYRSWHENGALECEGQFERGGKIGVWIYWDSTGSRTRETAYNQGIKHGMEIEWNPNGTMNSTLSYRHDKLHGLCTWYVPNNAILGLFNNPCLAVREEGFYLEGVLLLPFQDSTDTPCIGGLVGGREPYHNEERDLWIEWDKEKTKFCIGQMAKDTKIGLWILWSSTGDMIDADYFVDGAALE